MTHLRRVAAAAVISAAAFSAWGLVFGNLPRLRALFGARLLSAAFAAAGLAVIIAVVRLVRTLPPASAAKWAERAGTGLAGAFFGILAAGTFWSAAGRVVLAGAKEDVRRAGWPVEIPAARPKIADEDNAAYWYGKIKDAPSLADEKQRRADSLVLTELLDKVSKESAEPQDYEGARKLIARHQDGLALAARGAAKSGNDWGIEWGHDPIWEAPFPFPQIFGVVIIGRTLAVRALVEERQGHHREAVESVRLGLLLANSLGDQGILMTLGQVLVSDAALVAARVVLRGPSVGLALERWGPVLNPESVERGFWTGMGYEHYAQTCWYSRITWWDVAFGKYQKLRREHAFLTYYSPFIAFDIASALRANLKTDAAMRLPYPRMREEYRKALERASRTEWSVAAYGHPNYEHTFEKILAGTATIRLGCAALAARRFREKHGRWPGSMEELAGLADAKRLEDPFAAAPLRIAKVKNAIIIYSVGPDGRDDHAAAYDAEKMTGDLSWRL